MSRAVITGWQGDLDTIAMIKLVRAFTGLGLAEGKRLVEDVVAKKTVVIADLADERAKDFTTKARSLGIVCTIEVNKSVVDDKD